MNKCMELMVGIKLDLMELFFLPPPNLILSRSPWLVFQITASDEDEGVNSFVNYRIVQGDSGNHFRVGNTTGILRVALPLDRETLPSYTLVVEAFNPAVTNSSTDVGKIWKKIFYIHLQFVMRVYFGNLCIA